MSLEDGATWVRAMAALIARHPILLPIMSEVTTTRAGRVVSDGECLRDGDRLDLATGSSRA
ncbi:MAG: hypothetical protein N2111_07230 [Candidatus Sumerlaeaceae bacterium]|nr:hypothetical protein [Candidatus Sumerlaeaceae bacterium]